VEGVAVRVQYETVSPLLKVKTGEKIHVLIWFPGAGAVPGVALYMAAAYEFCVPD
jgi:hypothetical protein